MPSSTPIHTAQQAPYAEIHHNVPHLETTGSWEKNHCALKLCPKPFRTLDRRFGKRKTGLN